MSICQMWLQVIWFKWVFRFFFIKFIRYLKRYIFTKLSQIAYIVIGHNYSMLSSHNNLIVCYGRQKCREKKKPFLIIFGYVSLVFTRFLIRRIRNSKKALELMVLRPSLFYSPFHETCKNTFPEIIFQTFYAKQNNKNELCKSSFDDQ